MNNLKKLGLVIGGYVSACLVAGGVVYVYGLFSQDAASHASAGMYAFGDLMLFVGVFCLLAFLPTGLALYFLFRKFLPR